MEWKRGWREEGWCQFTASILTSLLNSFIINPASLCVASFCCIYMFFPWFEVRKIKQHFDFGIQKKWSGLWQDHFHAHILPYLLSHLHLCIPFVFLFWYLRAEIVCFTFYCSASELEFVGWRRDDKRNDLIVLRK